MQKSTVTSKKNILYNKQAHTILYGSEVIIIINLFVFGKPKIHKPFHSGKLFTPNINFHKI